MDKWKETIVKSDTVSEKFSTLQEAINRVYESKMAGNYRITISQFSYPDVVINSEEKLREFAARCGIVFLEE